MTGDGTEFCGPDFYAVGESAGHLGADESSATRLPCLGAGYAAPRAAPRHDSGGKTALATPLPRAPRPLVVLSHGPIRVAPDVVVLGA